MENIRYEKQGAVGVLTICRPKVLNALNKATLEELDSVLEEIENTPELSCVLLTGDGEKAFVAGADIAEMMELDEAGAYEFSAYGSGVFRRLESLDIPVIALVNGYALGGGCELVLSCDIVLASSNAVFALPETTLGVICGFGGTQRLAKRVGEGNAKRLIFTGDRIGADEALRIQLCDAVYAPESLWEAGMALAKRIGKNPKYAVINAKKAIDTDKNTLEKEGFQAESRFFSQCFRAGKANGHLRVFLERKK
jgi:enoyl-CoA hydratase